MFITPKAAVLAALMTGLVGSAAQAATFTGPTAITIPGPCDAILGAAVVSDPCASEGEMTDILAPFWDDNGVSYDADAAPEDPAPAPFHLDFAT